MTVFIDRSNVNGTDNYAAAPTTHIYLKVTEGTAFVDSTYQTRKHLAATAGAKTGGYHFARHADPKVEADFFLSKLGEVKAGDLRPCLDLEDGQSIGWAAAFLRRCKDELGFYPTLYGSTSVIAPMRSNAALLKNPLSARRVRKAPWWRAEYGPNDGHRHPLAGGDLGAVAHQYTSVAHVAGIAGVTDQSAILDEKSLLVPGETAVAKKWGVYHDGVHKRNFRRYARALMWARRHRPKEGHSIQIRHRKDG